MKTSKIKRMLETAGFVSVLAFILGGFIHMTVALIQRPPRTPVAEPPTETTVEAAPVEAPEFVAAPERNMEVGRSYRRPLAVHDMNGFGFSVNIPEDRPESYGVVVPNIAASVASPASGMAGLNEFRPPQAGRPTRREEDAEKEEEEGKVNTGWGWLADDIAKTRQNKELVEKQEAELRDPDASEREGLLVDGRGTSTERKSEGSPALFMDSSFQASRDPTAMRSPLREDQDRWVERGENNKSPEREPSAGDRPSDPDAQRVASEATGSRLVRDPFAREAEVARQERNDASWAFGSGAESAFQRRDAAGVMGLESRRETAGGFASPRYSETTVSDVGRSSAGWSGYGSDAQFNAGGGYSAMGVDASRSDALFSGSGVFGGGARFVPAAPTTPSALGGISTPSLGGSYGMPASGAGGSSRWETDRTIPRALPW